MLKGFVTALLLATLSAAAYSASDEEKKAEALNEATALVEKHRHTSDPATLQKIDSYIQKTWERYTGYYGHSGDLLSDLALIRARSTSATNRSKQVASHWKDAIRFLPLKTTDASRMSFYTQAANASSKAKDFRSAELFFAAARNLATVRGENADKSRLYLRLHELRTTGEAMEWRRLNDSLMDLRKFSQIFALWSIPRLDALVGEAEIRLIMQPNEDDEKRPTLGDLKAQIQLAQKGMNGAVPPMQVERIRTLFYALEDHFDL